MSNFLHLKDQFGNDMCFGNTGHVRLAAVPTIDYSTVLQTISSLPLREDDVIVVGYPKSGNNWTHHMTTMLKAGTTELPPLFESNSFFFLEGLSKNSSLTLPSAEKPRVFLTHLPFRFLPRDVIKKKVKVVYLTRNPKDVFVSLYCHLSNAYLPVGYGGTWDQFFTVMLEQGYWYGDLFDYLLTWQSEKEAHPDHPIFHCNYEDTKQDTLGQVQRLNQFLDTGRDRQLCEQIVQTCQLNNMHVTRPFNKEINKKLFLWKDDPTILLYRKGIVGDWKNWFTVAQNEVFDDVYNTKMADYKVTFRYE